MSANEEAIATLHQRILLCGVTKRTGRMTLCLTSVLPTLASSGWEGGSKSAPAAAGVTGHTGNKPYLNRGQSAAHLLSDGAQVSSHSAINHDVTHVKSTYTLVWQTE